jgi:hypothetical protein
MGCVQNPPPAVTDNTPIGRRETRLTERGDKVAVLIVDVPMPMAEAPLRIREALDRHNMQVDSDDPGIVRARTTRLIGCEGGVAVFIPNARTRNPNGESSCALSLAIRYVRDTAGVRVMLSGREQVSAAGMLNQVDVDPTSRYWKVIEDVARAILNPAPPKKS